MTEFESEFDKIFRLVGCNKLAKELLDKGLTYEEVKEIWG